MKARYGDVEDSESSSSSEEEDEDADVGFFCVGPLPSPLGSCSNICPCTPLSAHCLETMMKRMKMWELKTNS